MRMFFCCLSLVLFIVQAQAQSATIRIKAISQNKEPIAAATVKLISLPDSSSIQTTITDSIGTASFEALLHKPYKVIITSINYQAAEKNITVKDAISSFTFTMQSKTKSLSGVTVTANRPLMRQEDDKTIVDPENLALSSTNAYEIIEKTPGLFVDQDGNIYLSSTTPARVYINGREQKMSAADMATLLKSLPPNAIQSMEIMRTPSARYDASGGGGIVNVILRKGVRIGLTGSVNAGINQGVYGNRFAGFNINNSDGKWTEYINAQISRRNSFEEISSERFFSADSVLLQDARTKYPASSYFVNFGAGYQFTPKLELNYDGRYSHNKSENSSNNFSEILKVSSNTPVVQNKALVNSDIRSYNIAQSLNAKYKLDDAGSEWTADVAYTFSPNNNNQEFQTIFYMPFAGNANGDGTIKNALKFYSLQTNLLKKLSGKITVEGGVKSTNVNFENTTNYYRYQNGGPRIIDTRRSGSYKYTENINAGYLQASKAFGSIILKVGSRLENTNMSGHQLSPKDTSFSVRRSDFFPYVYLSRNLMKIAGYDLKAYLVYRRTINRPAYEFLNPSQRYVDPYLFETGNPSLRPQFTHNYEANISVDERPIFALGVNEATDIFTQVVYQADSSRSVAYRTYDNIGTNKEFYFRGIGAIPPGKRYFFVAGAQYNHNNYNGLYEGRPLQFKRGSWSIFTYQTFKITPLTQLSMHGFARFKGQLQFYELSSFGQLNLSLNQQLLNKKMTISLSATDVFYTNKNEFSINQGSMVATGLRQNDSRRFGLNIRYSFGIRKKEENKMPDVEQLEKGKP